jgi:hypothetical protein
VPIPVYIEDRTTRPNLCLCRKWQGRKRIGRCWEPPWESAKAKWSEHISPVQGISIYCSVCLCDVKSTKACSPAWLPQGPGVPHILWFQLCHFPKQYVLAVCQLHYSMDLPSLTVSTLGSSLLWCFSNRESTRLPLENLSRESVRILCWATEWASSQG